MTTENPSPSPVEAEDGDLFIVTPAEAGMRLDQFCQGQIADVSRARVQAWIDDGQVKLNDKTTKTGAKLKVNDRVFVATPPPPEDPAAKPENIPLTVVYEDDDLIVIDKPVGMVVHPAPGVPTGTLVNALLHHCKGNLSGIGGVARPGIVHRLDKDTSGLLVVAKHDKAHASLSAQIASKSAGRIYWCVVGGHMPGTDGRVDAPIARHPTQRQKMAVVQGGRAAATRWRVLESYKGFDWVECTLETGRTHQIRVHMTHAGHPVVGDPIYGGDRTLPVKMAGQALHARELSFNHPISGEALTFTAEPPEPLRKLLTYLQSTR